MCASRLSLLFASDVATGNQRLLQKLTVSAYGKAGKEEKEYFLSQPVVFLRPILLGSSQVPVAP